MSNIFFNLLKVYKAISDSLETRKMINYIWLSFILIYIFYMNKLLMVSVYTRKHQQIQKPLSAILGLGGGGESFHYKTDTY